LRNIRWWLAVMSCSCLQHADSMPPAKLVHWSSGGTSAAKIRKHY
jgi:hypothetical protein